MSLLGVVLAGGKSSRMGCDKSRIEIDGIPLVKRMATALDPVCDEVVISVDAFQFQDLGLNEIVDIWPGLGPMGGLLAGLKAADELGFDEVFLTSCDLFGFDPVWVSLLPAGQNAAFFDERWQPMVSRWQIDVLKDLPRENIGLWRALELVGSTKIQVPVEWQKSFSLNTPDDVLRAKTLIEVQ
jgi:molybdopterin-guanine dinucleotide biosynthesis protein A